MREFGLESGGMDGCCAVNTFFDFGSDEHGKPVTDAEWYKTLWESCLYNEAIDKAALWVFAHCKEANKGIFTPEKLALWLRSKNQSVSSKAVVNPKTGNHIVMYTWAPTKRFLNTYKKKTKKYDAEREGDSYSYY